LRAIPEADGEHDSIPQKAVSGNPPADACRAYGGFPTGAQNDYHARRFGLRPRIPVHA